MNKKKKEAIELAEKELNRLSKAFSKLEDALVVFQNMMGYKVDPAVLSVIDDVLVANQDALANIDHLVETSLGYQK